MSKTVANDWAVDSNLDPGNTVSVSLTFKKSLPDYQNITIHVGLTASVRPTENEGDTYKRAWGVLEEEFDKKVAEAVEHIAANA